MDFCFAFIPPIRYRPRPMRILIVEDEVKVRSFIRQSLEQAGFVVDDVTTMDDALMSMRTVPYDGVVLDRLLRRHDSLDEIGEVRKIAPNAKILILSALAEVDERVRGLNGGADDYLGKPFHVAELVARMRSLLRRDEHSGHDAKTTIIEYGKLRIDLETQRAYVEEKRIDLTGKEFRILCLLAGRPGKVFSKHDILDRVWDLNHYPESNVVEVVIANLRSKIDREVDCSIIHSKRGMGYWLGEP